MCRALRIGNFIYLEVCVFLMETVTISKKEYEKLKKGSEVDKDLLVSLVRGLEDIKTGRVKEWKPTA